MRDIEAISFIVEKIGTHIGAARDLGISSQSLTNWIKRGIPLAARWRFRNRLNRHGANLGFDWLHPRAPQQSEKGKTNGRASKSARKVRVKGKRKKGRKVRPEAKARGRA